jgi:hypothetical protein
VAAGASAVPALPPLPVPVTRNAVGGITLIAPTAAIVAAEVSAARLPHDSHLDAARARLQGATSSGISLGETGAPAIAAKPGHQHKPSGPLHAARGGAVWHEYSSRLGAPYDAAPVDDATSMRSSLSVLHPSYLNDLGAQAALARQQVVSIASVTEAGGAGRFGHGTRHARLGSEDGGTSWQAAFASLGGPSFAGMKSLDATDYGGTCAHEQASSSAWLMPASNLQEPGAGYDSRSTPDGADRGAVGPNTCYSRALSPAGLTLHRTADASLPSHVQRPPAAVTAAAAAAHAEAPDSFDVLPVAARINGHIIAPTSAQAVPTPASGADTDLLRPHGTLLLAPEGGALPQLGHHLQQYFIADPSDWLAGLGGQA